MSVVIPVSSLTRKISPSKACDLLDHLHCRRDEWIRWTIIDVRRIVSGGAFVSLGEIEQTLDFALQKATAHMLIEQHHGEILLAVHGAPADLALKLDALLRTAVGENRVKVMASSLSADGLNLLITAIRRWFANETHPSRISAVRLARSANVFLVLDDDPMVLRQMEHVLKRFGHVEGFNNELDFLDAYVKYAPNASFVDVHLKGESGIRVGDTVRRTLDPSAMFYIITADGVKDVVLQAKTMGAAGFLVKPINGELLIKSVLGCRYVLKRAA